MSEALYDTRGLKESIAHCRKTIQACEEAIKTQEQQITAYQQMIRDLQKRKKVSEGITINADSDD